MLCDWSHKSTPLWGTWAMTPYSGQSPTRLRYVVSGSGVPTLMTGIFPSNLKELGALARYGSVSRDSQAGKNTTVSTNPHRLGKVLMQYQAVKVLMMRDHAQRQFQCHSTTSMCLQGSTRCAVWAGPGGSPAHLIAAAMWRGTGLSTRMRCCQLPAWALGS